MICSEDLLWQVLSGGSIMDIELKKRLEELEKKGTPYTGMAPVSVWTVRRTTRLFSIKIT